MAVYFKAKEFRCRGNECKNAPDPEMDERLLEVLDQMRKKLGKPLIVLSGYRCLKHNRAIGSKDTSQHVKGKAADVYSLGTNVTNLAKLAEECGAHGIGIYYDKGFVHVDVRGTKARWTE